MRKVVVLALLMIIVQAQLAAVCGDVCEVSDKPGSESQPNCHEPVAPMQHCGSHDCDNTCQSLTLEDTLLPLHERPWVAPAQAQASFVDTRDAGSPPSRALPAAVAAPPNTYLGDVRLLEASLQV